MTDNQKECKLPYSIARNDVLGRYLVAGRDLEAGEVVLKEAAAVVGPRAEGGVCCVGCHRALPPAAPGACPRCAAPLCSGCPATFHSQRECALLAGAKLDVSPGVLTKLVMPLRCLLLREADPTKWEGFNQLESHVQERRRKGIWKSNEETVVKPLLQLQLPGVDAEAVQRVCGALDVNSFEVRCPGRPAERMRAVFLRAALMAHRCVPCVHVAVDDALELSVHTSVPVARNRPLFFNYTSALQGTADRLRHLREGKYFACRCARCLDPAELGTHMSSLKCPRQDGGYIGPCDGKGGEWRCSSCRHLYDQKLIDSTLARARELLEDADNTDPNALEEVLKTFSRTFHEQHSLAVDLKQTLAALYRDQILSSKSPPRKALTRKIELCRDLLPLLDTVEPGISRHKGITLYELHVPLVLLANKEFAGGELSAKQLAGRLQEAEGVLRQALEQLLHEPPQSPEGQLARAAIAELRALRRDAHEALNVAASGGRVRKSKQRK